MSFVLAVDGGGSKTEAALSDGAGTVLARGRAGPCNLYRAPEAAVAAVLEVWASCCAGAGLVGVEAATVVSAAVAGASDAAGQARFHAAMGGFAGVLLSTDVYAAVLGAFAGGPGVLLSVGTGSVACRLDEGGFVRIGGWGFPAGDRGGGAWIGLQAVSAWLEHLDGLAGDDALWPALGARLGAERGAILTWLRGASPGAFAGLAPLVVDAESAVAAAVLDAAAAHLAGLARALRPAGGVAMTGGLAGAMAGRVGERLGGEVLLRPGAVLAGAALIGLGRARPEFGPGGFLSGGASC